MNIITHMKHAFLKYLTERYIFCNVVQSNEVDQVGSARIYCVVFMYVSVCVRGYSFFSCNIIIIIKNNIKKIYGCS